MRKVFLDDLPRWQSGANKGRVNWKESIGYKVKFVYDEIEGKIEIVDNNSQNQYLFIKYLNNNIYKISCNNFTKCQLGKLLGKVTKDFRIEIGTQFKDNKRDLIVIDREYRKHGNNLCEKWYKYKCNKCGWDKGWVIEYDLLSGIGCSCCSNRTVVQGINDIPTTVPWMVKYFQGGYDEAKLYAKGSARKIKPICPDCGRIKNKEMSVRHIYNQHSINCTCSDSTSYPEKIMYSILEQLGIEFITQLNKFTSKWCDKYKYDFYIPSINCIIETHGLQHYEDGFKTFGGKLFIEEQENDRLKEHLAKENGIKHYIVIDCRYSELEYIKSNILNSELSNLFDLNKIDWFKCEEFALSNLVKIACDYKRNNPNMSSTDIGKIMKLCKNTISKYLKLGSKLGWCNYNPKEEQNRGRRKVGKMRCKTVEIFKNSESLGVFSSCVELAKQSEELFGVKLMRGNISTVCRGELSDYKGFTFKYI